MKYKIDTDKTILKTSKAAASMNLTRVLLIICSIFILLQLVNAATDPVVNSVGLNSTTGNNLTSDNLTAYNQTTNSSKTIYNWNLNGNSYALVNMPFEGGSTNVRSLDYALGNNATGGASWVRTDGYDGRGAYYFNCSNDNLGQHINLSSVNPKQITVLAWVKRNGSQTGSGGTIPSILAHWSYTDQDQGSWVIWEDSQAFAGGDFDAVYLDINISGKWVFSSPIVSTLPDKTWTFVGFSFNGSTIRTYRNGALVTSFANATTVGDLASFTYPIYIGCDGDNAGCRSTTYWNGWVDDFLMYNYSLSSEQIRAIYNNGTNKILSQELVIGQNWSVSVTPNNGSKDGSVVTSEILEIIPAGSSSTCTPPALTNTNWNVLLSDNCSITSTVNLGAGNFTLSGAPGNFTSYYPARVLAYKYNLIKSNSQQAKYSITVTNLLFNVWRLS